MCDSGTESDLESYSSVPPREIFGPHDDHLFPHDDFDTHFIEIDPRNLSYRSSTDVNTTSSRTSSSCETRHGGGGGTSSKPHKAHDCGWDAIRTVTSRDGDVGLNHFRFVQRLGSGDVGCVYLAELRGTSCYFAMKVMDKRALSGRNKLLRAQTEKEILEALDHPFLPTLYAHMDEKQFSCLVMEFCSGGDLHILRQRQPMKCFTEDAVRFYAAEVLLALEYLHMMGIVYRDLKPENVLVRDDGHIMLSDFDLSLKCNVNPVLSRIASVPHNPSSCLLPGLRCVAPCNIHPAASCLPLAKWKLSSSSHRRSPLPELVAEPTNIRSMSFVGTHEYLAPEIVVGDGHGSSVDWWTFGIFLFELLFGRTPFKGPDNEHTLMNIITQPLRFPVAASPSLSSNPSSPSPAAIDIIRSLLIKHPHKRLGAIRGASEIKHHPFFENLNWALIRCSVPPHIPISPCTTPHPSQPPSSLQSPWIMQGNPSDSFADFMFF